MADTINEEDVRNLGKHAREEENGYEKKRLCKSDFQNEDDALRSAITVNDGQEDTEAAENGQDGENPEPAEGQNKSRLSEGTEAAIQQNKERIETWTNQVSGLLEAGKAAFKEIQEKWEDTIIQLHEAQVGAWEEAIESLRNVDAANVDKKLRLEHVKALLSNF